MQKKLCSDTFEYKVTNMLQHLKLFCSQNYLILKIVYAVQNHLLPEGLKM